MRASLCLFCAALATVVVQVQSNAFLGKRGSYNATALWEHHREHADDATHTASSRKLSQDGVAGPDMDFVAAELFNSPGVTCGMVADAGFCGMQLFQLVCPTSCGLESYACDDNSQALQDYMGTILGYAATSCAATMEDLKGKNFASDMLEHVYVFCEHPVMGLACAASCGSDCSSWPPPQFSKVYLPNCLDHDLHYIPRVEHTALVNEKIVGNADSTYECPPSTSGSLSLSG